MNPDFTLFIVFFKLQYCFIYDIEAIKNPSSKICQSNFILNMIGLGVLVWIVYAQKKGTYGFIQQ